MCVTKSFTQNKACCTTYTFSGFIETRNDGNLAIDLNFLILLDSTLVGSYTYNANNGSLKLTGSLNSNNSFKLIERDSNDEITGFFEGSLSSDKKSASGKWSKNGKDSFLKFFLEESKKESYWDYIRKNRSLYEYTDFKTAIKEKHKVLSIDVADKNISKLPKELHTLTKILSINLMGNQFIEFPSVLSKLTTLTEISLSSNDLIRVGKEIGKLKNLKILILNFNGIKKLPKEIGNLTNLLYIDLGDNQLKNLPEEISHLTKLQELYIENNKLSSEEKAKIRKMLPNCVIHF